MFDFRDAFTYLFKEKNWQLKLLIPFVLQLIFILPTIILGLNNPETLTDLSSMNNAYRDNFRNYSTFSSISLIYSCFTLLLAIPFMITTLWYVYENTQAGIYKRETKAIWKNDFSDTLKKAAKYFVTSFFYGLFFLVFFLVVGGLFFCLGIVLIRVLGAGTNVDFNNIASLAGLSGIAVLLLCCFALIALVFYVLYYLLFTTSLTRLVATNTLSEGLKLRENWNLGMKYKWRFLSLLGFAIIFGLIFGLISASSDLLFTLLNRSSETLGLIYQVFVQSIFALITTFFSYFVYTRLLGQVFRSILKDEDNLDLIRVENILEAEEVV